MIATKVQKASEIPTTKRTEKEGGTVEQLVFFPLKDDSSRMVRVGSLLPKRERNRLLKFLHRNIDIFA